MTTMNTRDGILERFEHEALVVLGCPPAPGYAHLSVGGEGILLEASAVRRLIHALECTLVPYGEHELAPRMAPLPVDGVDFIGPVPREWTDEGDERPEPVPDVSEGADRD